MTSARTLSELDDERKENEYNDLMQLSQYSPLITIKALDGRPGRPPTRYEIVYMCRGYSVPGMIAERFVVNMSLPASYPRDLPYFEYDASTPIYHPHVFSHNRWICIGHERGMPVGLPLRQYVIGVGEMIQWRKDTDGRGGPVDERSLVGVEPEAEVPSAPAARPGEAPPPPPPREDDLSMLIEIEEAIEPVPQSAPIPTPAETVPPAPVSPSSEPVIVVISEPSSERPRPTEPDHQPSPSTEQPLIIVLEPDAADHDAPIVIDILDD